MSRYVGKVPIEAERLIHKVGYLFIRITKTRWYENKQGGAHHLGCKLLESHLLEPF